MAEAFIAAVTYAFEAIGATTIYAEAIGTVLYYAAPCAGAPSVSSSSQRQGDFQ